MKYIDSTVSFKTSAELGQYIEKILIQADAENEPKTYAVVFQAYRLQDSEDKFTLNGVLIKKSEIPRWDRFIEELRRFG